MRERTSGDGRLPVESVERHATPASSTCPAAHGLDLADTDEVAASEARARYREQGLESLEPDEAIRRHLMIGEQVLAVRRGVALDRRLCSTRVSVIDSIHGDLYVTTDRLVHLGRQTVTIDLDEIEDSALVAEKVLLVLRDGVGVALDADRPHLLRVQIATARTARTARASVADGPRVRT